LTACFRPAGGRHHPVKCIRVHLGLYPPRPGLQIGGRAQGLPSGVDLLEMNFQAGIGNKN
jgi:hypothetical protein